MLFKFIQNSYAREIEENIHSELRKHLWSTSVRFCCGAFSNSSISMVNYKASVDDPKVLSDIADWKEMQQCQLGKFLVELNKNFPISPEDNDIC